MERRLITDGMTEQEQLAVNTITELMTSVNANTFSEEAKNTFMEMMKQDIGLECIEAMRSKWIMTEDESNYLIGALTILVRSKTNA
jgi:hypothetical protein